MDARLLNPLMPVYMGDAVLGQYVREHIVFKLQSKPNCLHQASKQYVSVKNQAQTFEVLVTKERFIEGERDTVRRGRNAKSYMRAKNTDIQTHRKSSDLEAIIEFLYSDHRSERLDALLDMTVQVVDERL